MQEGIQMAPGDLRNKTLKSGIIMAPGELRKQNLKSNLNKPKERLATHTFKHAPSNSTTLKGIFDKENGSSYCGMSRQEKEAFATSETQHTSSKGTEPAPTANIQTRESDNVPENTVPPNQTLETPSNESPAVHSNERPHNPSTETTTATASKKRARGQTMGKGIMKAFAASERKMKINVDPFIGRPVNGEESAKLSSQIGIVTRDFLPVPKRWKEVDVENGLGPSFAHMQMHLDVNIDDAGVRESLIDRLKSSSRQKRYKLHMHYKKFSTPQEAKANKPLFCPTKRTWEALCDHFATSKFKHASYVNSGNRNMLRAPDISGRKPFVVRRHEISQNELNGVPCDRIELYKRTHHSEKKGWASKVAEENWELMKKKQEQYNEEGAEKTTDEIVLEVLGHGTGYIKGLGYGPKPPSKRTTSYDLAAQQLQKELEEAQQKLQASETQVNELKAQVTDYETEVTDLRNQVGQQGASINKLIQLMTANGINMNL